MKREVRFVFAWLFLTCLPFTAANAAPVPIISFSGGTLGTGPGVDQVTIGYEFNVSNIIHVTDIGWFDYLDDGLAAAHALKLWDSTGVTEYLSEIIPAGTGGSLEADGFRYYPLSSPVTLLPGNYVIGGTANSVLDYYVGRASAIGDTVLGISYLNPRINYLDPLAFPAQQLLLETGGFFGPNLKAVPIPPAVWLFGSGLIGLVGIARMKKAAR